VVPSSYWWGARIEAMSPEEQASLLARETSVLGLDRADSERCPLCRAEVPLVWTLIDDGKADLTDGPIECPRCDFRLDACRHCAHFLPGAPQGWLQPGLGDADMTSGRCDIYKASQPVEDVCGPELAGRLRTQGYDQIRGPRRVADSFFPPDFCTAFELERKRLHQGGIRWPDARRVALLRLLAPRTPQGRMARERQPTDDELWLVWPITDRMQRQEEASCEGRRRKSRAPWRRSAAGREKSHEGRQHL
jgi:hypothetical protein